MNARRLVLASLAHHWRSALGVAAGAAVATAVLVGALLVGDSVRGSLRAASLARVGRAELALVSGERSFTAGLAQRLEAELPGLAAGAALDLAAIASLPGGTRRVAGVRALGVDEGFLAFAPGAGAPRAPERGEVLLSLRLASELDARTGDTLLLRVELPSALPRDAVLAPIEDTTAALRLEVAGVLDDAAFGRFSLQAGQLPPRNAFVSLAELEERVELVGRRNLLLARGTGAPLDAAAALARAFTLEDAQLTLRTLGEGAVVELGSERVFLDPPVARAAAELDLPLVGLSTYFVTAIEHGERATPYSTVAAVGPLTGIEIDAPHPLLDWRAVAPAPGDIAAHPWLADDLEVAPGATLALTYFALGATRALETRTTRFELERVVDDAGLAADPEAMPAIPGLEGSEHCRDWDPGIPIELDRIRPEDEAWWEERRGTPKAFLALESGRETWGNRYGSLTAIRAPAARADELRAALGARIAPASVGLELRPLRAEALAASDPPTDFGGLFLGLGSFLIGAALLLTGLFFAFGVEQRERELGALAAMGFSRRAIRRLLLAEALVIALVGALAGSVLGLGFTRLVLWGLATVWEGAVASAQVELHARASTILLGALASIAAAMLAMAFALGRSLARPATELLASRPGFAAAELARPRPARGTVALALLLAAAAIALAASAGGTSAELAGRFFGAGGLLLVAGLAATRALLVALQRRQGERPESLAALGRRQSARRRGRSAATVALLAAGTFLVVAVGANRLVPPSDPRARDSGTGGFALWAEATIPFYEDPASAAGIEAFALDAEVMEGVRTLPLRVREGDEASCLNLAAPGRPRLMGVDARALAERGAFRFAEHAPLEGGANPWELLELRPEADVVPAIGDAASVRWTLHESLGGELEYQDERGRPFRVRIVATLADSILQGALVIDRAAFEERFPSTGGYRALLVDAPPGRAPELARELGAALEDHGLELLPTEERLRAFQAVQNTYLAIFQVLGALGLLLGSLGLGAVVLRNALERRHEWAVLRAVGFAAADLRRLLVAEHGLLIALGLGIGSVAALVAVAPGVRLFGALSVLGPALAIVTLAAASGWLWVALAARLAAREELAQALREE